MEYDFTSRRFCSVNDGLKLGKQWKFCCDWRVIAICVDSVDCTVCCSTFCGSTGGESRWLHFVATHCYVQQTQYRRRYTNRAIIGNAGRKLGYRAVLKCKALFLVTSNWLAFQNKFSRPSISMFVYPQYSLSELLRKHHDYWQNSLLLHSSNAMPPPMKRIILRTNSHYFPRHWAFAIVMHCAFWEVGAEYMYMCSAPTSQKTHTYKGIPVSKDSRHAFIK